MEFEFYDYELENCIISKWEDRFVVCEKVITELEGKISIKKGRKLFNKVYPNFKECLIDIINLY